jgi:hypothetical protein
VSFYIARYFWNVDKLQGVGLQQRIVRFLDHLFLTGFRYRHHVANWRKP